MPSGTRTPSASKGRRPCPNRSGEQGRPLRHAPRSRPRQSGRRSVPGGSTPRAPVAGEDTDDPHRGRSRLSRLAYPTSPKARHRQILRIPVSGQEGASLHHGQGEELVLAGREPAAREALLYQLNLVLRGRTAYFKHGSSKATFNYLRAYTWKQVFGWLRRKHRRSN
ncbi:group II intron maturase-specific domain-containing protein [Streptomyces sp. NPDC059679]|uniref:group II intron maturase-specific domain-containing protein n=1 Tax=Streptomyces sp. NPDC059679 TaxID=3346903 RepID=UPI003680173E